MLLIISNITNVLLLPTLQRILGFLCWASVQYKISFAAAFWAGFGGRKLPTPWAHVVLTERIGCQS